MHFRDELHWKKFYLDYERNHGKIEPESGKFRLYRTLLVFSKSPNSVNSDDCSDFPLSRSIMDPTVSEFHPVRCGRLKSYTHEVMWILFGNLCNFTLMSLSITPLYDNKKHFNQNFTRLLTKQTPLYPGIVVHLVFLQQDPCDHWRQPWGWTAGRGRGCHAEGHKEI